MLIHEGGDPARLRRLVIHKSIVKQREKYWLYASYY
jgi:hypothetical protein